LRWLKRNTDFCSAFCFNKKQVFNVETEIVMLPPPTLSEVQALLDKAVIILRAGGLVAFPTETVYGLGADAENPEALNRLYRTKGRPKGHPVIVHLASAQQLGDWACDIPANAFRLAESFWPGPLTLILKRSERVPDAVTGGQDTVGIRVPGHPLALQLLQAFGGGIAAPSANRFGRLSPTSARHVQDDLGQDVDLILDGGDCQVGVESTIVAFQGETPIILRPGMITAEQIEAVLSQTFSEGCEAGSELQLSTVSRVPGTLASHYAPNTQLQIIPSATIEQIVENLLGQGLTLGVLARRKCPGALLGSEGLCWAEITDDPNIFAQKLYAQLRDLDERRFDRILVEAPPSYGAWAAVADRLQRAAYRSDSQ
jgi:L-threonylcarbamoyladenylate synthase